jgi:O-antigen/teichoic acid export membrane protein
MPSRSLIRNTLAQLSPVFVAYVFSFLSAPIVVSGLGIRAFGIWALTGALAQYGGLFDLGVGRSLSRYVAAHHKDRQACGEYIMLGFLSVVGVGVVLMALAFATAPLLARTIHGVSVANMRIILTSSVVLMIGTMLTSVIAAYPVGMLRMVAPNIGIALGSVVNFTASVGAIAVGLELPGYAIANAVAAVVTVVIVTVLVLRVEGRPPIARPQHGRAREFLSYSTKSQLAWAMELVNYQSDKIVIAISVGPSAAGAYELANRVAAAARQIGIFPSTALLPTLTADLHEFGMDHLRHTYQRLTEIIVSLAFPFLWLVASTSPLLLLAWLGHVPASAEIVLPALCIAYLAGVSSDTAKVVASAAGVPRPFTRSAVGTAIVNVAVTVSLAPLFGLWGILAGTVVALTGGALVQVVMVQRRFRLPKHAYPKAVLPSLRLCALLALPVFAISYSGLIHGRLHQALVLIILAACYLSVYFVLSTRDGRLPTPLIARIPWLRRLQVAAG